MKILFVVLLFTTGCIEFGDDGEIFPESMSEKEHREKFIEENTDPNSNCWVNKDGNHECSFDKSCKYDSKKQELTCKKKR